MKKVEIDSLIQNWLEVGAISPEQASFMTTEVARTVSEKSGGKFISAVMYIGAAALSAGALLFIASNWEYLTKGIKLVLAFLLPIIPLAFAYFQLVVKEKSEFKVLGRAANIFGLALIGGSLALIGQIYNLEANIISFLWTWALLTLPFVFVFKKSENVFFSAVLLGAALFASLIDFLDSANMDERALVLLLTSTSLLYAYVLYIIGVALRYAIGWSESGRLLRLLGAGLAATLLFFMTFEFYARAVVGSSYNNSGNWQVVSIALNLLFLGFLVFALARAVKHEEYAFAFSIVRLAGLYIVVKYFTLFYTMFDTGLLFMVGGVIFIVGGWLLEKNRGLLTAHMKNSFRPVS